MIIRTHPQVRRLAVLAVVALATALLLVPTASKADVTSVVGSAFGYQAVGVHGPNPTDVPSNPGPAPVVNLPATGSATPLTADAGLTVVRAGQATVFSFASAHVSTQGTTGPGGSVTSTATLNGLNQSTNENLTATSLSSTCSARETDPATGAVTLSGSTTIMGGSVVTDSGQTDPTAPPLHPETTQTIGDTTLTTAPLTIEGHLHIGDQTDFYRYVFNEQTISPDGKTITVTAAHLTLGTMAPAIAGGDLYIGRSVCGLTTVAAPTTTTTAPTTTTTAPTTTTTTAPTTTTTAPTTTTTAPTTTTTAPTTTTTAPTTTTTGATTTTTGATTTTTGATTTTTGATTTTTGATTTTTGATTTTTGATTTTTGATTTTSSSIPPGTTSTTVSPFSSLIQRIVCPIFARLRTNPIFGPFLDRIFFAFGCAG